MSETGGSSGIQQGRNNFFGSAIPFQINLSDFSENALTTLFPNAGFFGANPLHLEGLPKGVKTQRAVQALFASGIPALRELAHQFKLIHDSGADLASGNPALRNTLGAWVHHAIQALENLGIPRKMAFHQVSNAINFGTVPNFNRFFATRPRPEFSGSGGAASGGLNDFLEKYTPTPLNPLPPGTAAIVGGTLGFLEGGPAGAVEGAALGREAAQLYQEGLDGFTNLFRGQPNPGPSIPPLGNQPPYSPGPSIPPLGNQPPYSPPDNPPVVPTLQTCTTCGYVDPHDRNLLENQRTDLQREIRTEQEQYTEQRITDQQKMIDDLRDLERLPPSQRDIPRELQQKQQLLSAITTELGGGQPDSGQPVQQIPRSGTVPTLDYRPAQIGPLQPPTEQPGPFIQRQPHDNNPNPTDSNAVKFCVQCSSQAESLKFLNGEPSECSVLS